MGSSVASNGGQVQVAHQVGVAEDARALGEKENNRGNEQNWDPEPYKHGVVAELELVLAPTCDRGVRAVDCACFALAGAAGG